MKLYHTSKTEIRNPDIHHGRRNADFGWGFYLTPDLDFARRRGQENAVINEYEFSLDDLNVYRFERSEDWFSYIFHNRRGRDNLNADVIIGPIANDTIFETYGVISSGYLKPEEAMKLLMIGPQYVQIALKTERAAGQLKWTGAQKVEKSDLKSRRQEQEDYSLAFTEVLQNILPEDEA